MSRLPALAKLLLALFALSAAPAAAADRVAGPSSPTGFPASSPAEACRVAIAATERAARLPPQLLAAIAKVESGRFDPGRNRVMAWPWTINAAGQSYFFTSKADAIARVQELQAQGTASIDVGCLQVNLMHHPDAFPSLDVAFDPVANANYAGRFLNQLRERTGDWGTAAAQYHSATPDLGAAYQAKVMVAWTEEQRFAQAMMIKGIPVDSGTAISPELARSGSPLPGLGRPSSLQAALPRPVRLTSTAPRPVAAPICCFANR